jgi:hypothetical protein
MTAEEERFAWHEAEKDLYSGIDTSVPHSARIWNYWLGGKDNFPVDRQAGDEYVQVFPGIIDLARHSRAFLTRAVRHLAVEEGVRQFLDIGTGLPTFDNTHEVAQRAAPDARIVYVDNDPLVLLHARALLTSTPEGVTAYVEADLHVAEDGEAKEIIRRLLDGLPSGSFLVLYDGTATDESFAEAQEGYDETGAVPYRLRKPEQVIGFFEGLELLEPGVVPVALWRPEPSPFDSGPRAHAYGGVGRRV